MPSKEHREKSAVPDHAENPAINRIRPAKLADAVADYLEVLILEGSLRAGDRLLPERELANSLEVSRPSLREALDVLENRGLLASGRGGTRIAPLLGTAFNASLSDLAKTNPNCISSYLEFRRGMEGVSAYYAALRATKIDRDHMRQRLEEIERADAEGDPAAEAAADIRFHMAIYETSHNLIMLHVMSSLGAIFNSHVFSSRDKLYQYKGVRAILLEQHRAIAGGIIGGDAETARQATEAHIAFTRQAFQEIDIANQHLEKSLQRMVSDAGEGR